MLSRELESVILRILDGPDEHHERLLRELCAAHPDAADSIREHAVARKREFEASKDPPETRLPAEEQAQTTASEEKLKRLRARPAAAETRYQFDGEVGRGGMGAVLRVRDLDLGRNLAMKVILGKGGDVAAEGGTPVVDPQVLQRFLDEAQITGQLDHPGVVPVHELGIDAAGRVYFTMRLVRGETADGVFAAARQGRDGWTQTRALEVVLKVCDTMAFAHKKAVLHRDLKPSNVMVGKFGEVYVMDWGLAKVLGEPDHHNLRLRPESTVSRVRTDRSKAEVDSDSPLLTMDGAVVGTPSYMAPEQAEGRIEILDQRADVYAVGAMLYQLLSGRQPYVNPGARVSPYAVLAAVQAGPPVPVHRLDKTVPAELVAICEKAMARTPEERYQDMRILADDLRAYLDKRVVKAYRTGPFAELAMWVRRNRALAGSLAAAVLILFAGIAATMALNASLAVENQKNLIFADAAKLAAARSIEESLYPAWPEQVPAMLAWLASFGDPLAARLPMIEQALKDVQARAVPKTEAQWQAARGSHPWAPKLQQRRAELAAERDEYQMHQRRAEGAKESDPHELHQLREQIKTLENDIAVAGFEFQDAADDYLHRTLVRLVRELDEFCAPKGPLVGVRARLAAARTVQQETLDACRAKWDEAIAAIRASDRYGHLELKPQMGLVPIGVDQDSKLWEFVHLASGTPGQAIPQRAANGRLVPDGDMGIVFVLLPGGTLPNGLPLNEDGMKDPRLEVKLDAFFLGKYEMTQGQWLRLTGANPSYSKYQQNLALPVENVTWSECEELLRHQGFELPSELRWEYGCRAGTCTLWWTGNTTETLDGRENVGEKAEKSLSVGSLAGNRFGLFDIAGNHREWCRDDPDDYGTERAGDGLRPPTGEPARVIRGGCFGNDADDAQSGTTEYRSTPNYRRHSIGVRPARTLRP